MGDADNFQPSKKRAAGIQLTKDNPGLDDEETSEQEMGTFKKASDEVLANRRIVKVRRNTAATPSSNPFAAIRLIPPSDSQTPPTTASTEAVSGKTTPEKVEDKNDANKQTDESAKLPKADVIEAKPEPTSEKEETANVGESDEAELADENIIKGTKTDEEAKKNIEANDDEGEASKDAEKTRNDAKTENCVQDCKKDADDAKTDSGEKEGGDKKVQHSAETAPFSSFQQLSSSQNAFTGFAGTGFSGSTFSFGSVSKDGSGSLFGIKNEQPSFSFGLSSNGNSSLFGSSGASIVSKSEGTKLPSMQEVPVETGEENEKAVFTADCVLFEYFDGGWKERGKGELKINVLTTGSGKARLIMRTKGNYRLILNASLYPDMKLTNMEKRGITFACINSASEGKDGLSTYAAKFKDASFVEEFRAAVTEHKGKTAVSLKTPENSPKASDD